MGMTFQTDVEISSSNSLKTNKVLAPTTSGGSTYGAGTNGQALMSNGTNTYWGTVSGGGSSSALSLTLASGSWTSATPPTQTVSATGVTANSNIVVGLASTATSAQIDAAAAGKLLCTGQGSGEITVTCYGTEPSVNIPITVLIVG